MYREGTGAAQEAQEAILAAHLGRQDARREWVGMARQHLADLFAAMDDVVVNDQDDLRILPRHTSSRRVAAHQLCIRFVNLEGRLFTSANRSGWAERGFLRTMAPFGSPE
jgi:hypothetical protein